MEVGVGDGSTMCVMIERRFDCAGAEGPSGSGIETWSGRLGGVYFAVVLGLLQRLWWALSRRIEQAIRRAHGYMRNSAALPGILGPLDVVHCAQITNMISFGFSLLGTSMVIRRLGLRKTLLAFPILCLCVVLMVMSAPKLYVSIDRVRLASCPCDVSLPPGRVFVGYHGSLSTGAVGLPSAVRGGLRRRQTQKFLWTGITSSRDLLAPSWRCE